VQHGFAYAVSALCHVCLPSKLVQCLHCLPQHRLLLLLPLQGRVTISNDGATIMKLLDVVHPAAKTLVDVSLSQDAEVRAVVCMFTCAAVGACYAYWCLLCIEALSCNAAQLIICAEVPPVVVPCYQTTISSGRACTAWPAIYGAVLWCSSGLRVRCCQHSVVGCLLLKPNLVLAACTLR
jgi:hypothetical protein